MQESKGWIRSGRRSLKELLEANRIRAGRMRRLNPVSRQFGYDRGLPVDRHYIEEFLLREAKSIHGRVLEIGDSSYTKRFGGQQVTQSDVLHVQDSHPGATFIGDLSSAPQIPSDSFDCLILTQTLHLIYDFRSAARTIHRILKPGGTVLLTVPGISQIDHGEWEEAWYWSFTRQSVKRVFEEVFPPQNLAIATYGNVWVATAFLHGLAVTDLRRDELEYYDPYYQLVITMKGTK